MLNFKIKIVKSVRALFFLVLFLISSNCTKKTEQTEAVQAKAAGEINLAIWSNYISAETIQKFTEKTGIKVNVSNYSSNEDLLAKIQVGGSGIDMAVPSDYMVEILSKQGLLHTLDKSKIPNLSNVSQELLAQDFDSTNSFSVPYSWTTSGIAVNRDLFKGKLESWKDVLENNELKGKVSLLDDVRETTGLALKQNGASLNTTDVAELKKAKDYLLKVKKNIKAFQSDSVDLLINKEVAVAQAYSSDALKAWAQTNGKIEYILPIEGGSRAIDNLVILKNSKNSEQAHQLINFLLTEEVNVAFVSTMFGGPILSTTRSKLSEQLKNNSALFPSAESLKKLESIKDLGEKSALYDDIWVQVKTNN